MGHKYLLTAPFFVSPLMLNTSRLKTKASPNVSYVRGGPLTEKRSTTKRVLETTLFGSSNKRKS